MSGLPILTYHAIGEGSSPTSIPRAWFIETITALLEAGFHGVNLVDWVSRGRPDEPRGFAIAFDDGLLSILSVADFLVRHKIRSTIFLVTDYVGRDNNWPGQPAWVARERTLSWWEIGDLAAVGFQFGAHGITHDSLDRCESDRLQEELRGSRDAIEQRLGRACSLVAYPYGRSSRKVETAASEVFAAGFGTRLDYASKHERALALSRIDAHYLRDRYALNSLSGDEWRGWLGRRRIARGLKRRVLHSLSVRKGAA